MPCFHDRQDKLVVLKILTNGMISERHTKVFQLCVLTFVLVSSSLSISN